ncbi:putative membrane protein [Leptospira wolbachii serovar Codice str. CDC]|uniref:Membrane protein n=1 Tax=Leptospira wolbachii serovar Codice str. CDC TaxID=1218599 RepID=R9A7L2_9LEPT|nr:hypothetical protein [Leptospira wolbachii]EOQ98176.1 putative membrane protein [Leptospira wolbachii serovar Codice str. CDC]
MKILLVTLLAANLVSFVFLGFFPEFFLALLFSLLLLTLVSSFRLLQQSINYRKKKQNIIFIISLSFLFLLVSYISEIRWSLNPFGMLDAYAMWVGKGRMLALSILDGNPLPIWNKYWRMPNYPLGIPFLHADLSLVFSSLSEFLITLKIPNYLYLVLLYFFLIERTLDLQKSVVKWGFLIMIGAFLFHPNYLLVISDLCADFPVSVTIAIATYFLIKRDKEKDFYWIFFAIALLINLKSEALLISIVLCGFYILYAVIEKTFKIQFFMIALLLLVLFGSPTWYLFGKGSFLSSDFKGINQSSSHTSFIIERLLDGDLWYLVTKFFLKFYLTLTKGLSFVLLAIVLIWGSLNLRIGVLFYFVSVSIYTGIFLLTSLDPQVHLEQAYDRIHFQLFLIPLVIFGEFGKENEEVITKGFTGFRNELIKQFKRMIHKDLKK